MRPLNPIAYQRFSRLDNTSREKMRHLRCLCFVRPSPDSVQQLIDEFRDPKYGEYVICEEYQKREMQNSC